MIPVLLPAEMAAVDAAAPEPVEVLIERAGAAVAREALRLLGGAYGRRVVVVAGKGNNGADGRAAAVRLRRRGVRVEVVEAVDAPAPLPAADLVVDAAYGTGLRGAYDAPDAGGTPVLAVDIPSGVDGITGETGGRVLEARRTVTFAALKPGLLLGPGRRLAGEVVVADIGLDVSRATAHVVEAADVAAWLPARPADAHKWTAAVMVVAGSAGMTGAAHLAAAAAQRAGAGMVRLATPGLADDPNRPTEAVGLRLPDDGWAEAVSRELHRFGSMVVGPGLGTDLATQGGIRLLLGSAPVATVVDGDALTAVGRDLGVVRDRVAATVLTPHDAEMARLTGAPTGPDRLAASRALAADAGVVVLLKGPTTVVADPAGQVRIVATGDARLATAGTGDVLSGVIGALLARGVPALEAAAAGAWLHARAASLGPAAGLVASDLLALLPRALAEVTP
ncbi:MAG TPA: NAD(P)H-hydrate dehydratase [Acidimicrobiales bacterium]|nr:NAD(P)H-hydrate dehydratase [Acidimicrobiales bacterium]